MAFVLAEIDGERPDFDQSQGELLLRLRIVWFLLVCLLPLVAVAEEKPAVNSPPDSGLPEKKSQPISQIRASGYFTGAWKIEKGWDRAAELEFAAFVETFGRWREKKTFRLWQGIRDPEVNPLWTEEDLNFDVVVDCATFPYIVRAYFAYKTKRPFSYQANKCRRYGKTNSPESFADWSQFEDVYAFFKNLDGVLSSGHFRMTSTMEGTDTYPIEISMETVLPGTVYYDPNGHVMLVYKVDHHGGEITFLDSHPDGCMTMRTFGPRYAVGSARYGGGFRAWRHYDVEVLDQETGAFKVTRKLNSESDFYDPEQQYQGEYVIDGHKLDYHEWMRARVSKFGIYTYPLEDFTVLLDSVCEEVTARVNSVNAAMDKGLHLKRHPNKLPFNIFGASGEWEDFATPGRDVRIRAAFKEAYDYVRRTMVLAFEGSSRLKYECEPWELHREFRRIWDEHVGNELCTYRYTNSVGDTVTLTLDDIMDRLFDISFDPYQCPEMRWGANPDSRDKKIKAEFSTCPDPYRKIWWYRQENQLRNRLTRLLGAGTPTHRGPEFPADLHVPKLFDCYEKNSPEFEKCHVKKKRRKKPKSK